MLRVRSERIQALTAALSGSVTQQDVADVVVEAVATEMRADASVFAIVLDDREVQRKLAWYGYGDELQEPWLEVPLSPPTPGNRALDTREATSTRLSRHWAVRFPRRSGACGTRGTSRSSLSRSSREARRPGS